jgi:hypothetical protein
MFWPKGPKVAPDDEGRFTLWISEGGPPGLLVISLLMVPSARSLEFEHWYQLDHARRDYPAFDPTDVDIELDSVSVHYDPAAP